MIILSISLESKKKKKKKKKISYFNYKFVLCSIASIKAHEIIIKLFLSQGLAKKDLSSQNFTPLYFIYTIEKGKILKTNIS
jgi:hypothetical protein